MFTIPDQFSSAAKANLEAQLSIFTALTSKAFESVEKVVDLNLNGEFSFPVIELLNQRSVPVIVCSGYVELPEVRTRLQGIPHVGEPWMPERLDALMRDVLTATRVVG